uniref:Complement C3d receptor 2 n=1 Tax=Myotis lucifugus TaxID=59463 RepID=G1Q6S1_MYOLU
FEPGTSIKYSCDPGYVLVGEESINCTSDGVWTPTVPKCKEITCPPPPVIDNGAHTGTPYVYNDSVTFKCDDGFTLKGSSEIRCKANDTWDPEIPVCEKGSLAPLLGGLSAGFVVLICLVSVTLYMILKHRIQ